MAETNPKLENLMLQRDAHITLLLAQCHEQLRLLALLAMSEKTAVAGLIRVGEAVGRYASGARPDQDVMNTYLRMISELSPALGQRLSFPNAPDVQNFKFNQDIESIIKNQIQQIKYLLASLAPATAENRNSGDTHPLPSNR